MSWVNWRRFIQDEIAFSTFKVKLPYRQHTHGVETGLFLALKIPFTIELADWLRTIWACSYPTMFLADSSWLNPVWSQVP